VERHHLVVSAVGLDLSNGTLDSLAMLFHSGHRVDKKKTSPGFEKRSTENPKRQGVFRGWHLVISYMPSSATRRYKDLDHASKTSLGYGNHPSYEQNLVALNWPWETMMLHQTEVHSHFGPASQRHLSTFHSEMIGFSAIFQALLASPETVVRNRFGINHQDTQWNCTRCDGYCDFLSHRRSRRFFSDRSTWR